jgi:hypothetical protein
VLDDVAGLLLLLPQTPKELVVAGVAVRTAATATAT